MLEYRIQNEESLSFNERHSQKAENLDELKVIDLQPTTDS